MTQPRFVSNLLAILALTLAAVGVGILMIRGQRAEQVKQPQRPSVPTVEEPIVVNGRDYTAHLRQLRRKLPSSEFHVVVEHPFVVIGDQSEEQVRGYARSTVRWAVERLKLDYFRQDPDEILDVWLFKDEASYRKHTAEIFGDNPSTPYGYFSRRHGALIMNIDTGGGTLVHEIVHPFIAANFPDCPSWFNEGLASLYEQCRDVDGHIKGSTNWRLRGLQLAIGDERLGSFEQLCGTTTREFYDDEAGTNYAQARYLCYYLQEQGKLVDFYHRFRRNAGKDPSGLETLKQILEEEDLQDFQQRWEAYVLKLRFPE